MLALGRAHEAVPREHVIALARAFLCTLLNAHTGWCMLLERGEFDGVGQAFTRSRKQRSQLSKNKQPVILDKSPVQSAGSMVAEAGAVAPADGSGGAQPAGGNRMNSVLSGLLRLGIMYAIMTWMRKGKTPAEQPDGAGSEF
jgi:hypothetical protein